MKRMFIFSPWILLISLIKSSLQQTGSFFKDCDIDRDEHLNLQELKSCLQDQSQNDIYNHLNEISYKELFSFLDSDHDGLVSLKEYATMQANRLKQREKRSGSNGDDSKEDSDDFIVQTRDGKKKTYSRQQLQNAMDENMKGIKRGENNTLLQETDDVSSISELQSKDPKLAKFIRLGQWSHEFLKRLGHINGNLTGLLSLSTDKSSGAESSTSEDLQPRKSTLPLSSNYVVRLLLKVTEEIGGSVVQYVVEVEYNPQLYMPPHLAMKSAEASYPNGTRIALTLPPLPTLRTFSGIIKGLISGRMKIVLTNFPGGKYALAGFIALVFTLGVTSFLIGRHYLSDEEVVEGNAPDDNDREYYLEKKDK